MLSTLSRIARRLWPFGAAETPSAADQGALHSNTERFARVQRPPPPPATSPVYSTNRADNAQSPRAGDAETPEQRVQRLIDTHAVVIFSKTTCPYCTRAKELFASTPNKAIVEFDQESTGDVLRLAVRRISGMTTVPVIYVNGQLLGGSDAAVEAAKNGTLNDMLRMRAKL